MRQCPNCGAGSPDRENHCEYCGSELNQSQTKGDSAHTSDLFHDWLQRLRDDPLFIRSSENKNQAHVTGFNWKNWRQSKVARILLWFFTIVIGLQGIGHVLSGNFIFGGIALASAALICPLWIEAYPYYPLSRRIIFSFALLIVGNILFGAFRFIS